MESGPAADDNEEHALRELEIRLESRDDEAEENVISVGKMSSRM